MFSLYSATRLGAVNCTFVQVWNLSADGAGGMPLRAQKHLPKLCSKKCAFSLSQDNNPTEKSREHSEKNWTMMLESLKKLLGR